MHRQYFSKKKKKESFLLSHTKRGPLFHSLKVAYIYIYIFSFFLFKFQNVNFYSSFFQSLFSVFCIFYHVFALCTQSSDLAGLVSFQQKNTLCSPCLGSLKTQPKGPKTQLKIVVLASRSHVIVRV